MSTPRKKLVEKTLAEAVLSPVVVTFRGAFAYREASAFRFACYKARRKNIATAGLRIAMKAQPWDPVVKVRIYNEKLLSEITVHAESDPT